MQVPFYLRILPLFLVFCITTQVNATLYPKRLKLQHFLENRDLILGEVRAIYQDSQGFMWFGGWNGVWRFDGYELKPIKAVVDRNGDMVEEPLASVMAITEDDRGYIWISMVSAIAKYDPRMDLLTFVEDSSTASIAISKVHIPQIVSAPNGKILAIASNNEGFLEIDPDQMTYEVITKSFVSVGTSKQNIELRFNSVYVSENNEVWLGTSHGVLNFHVATRRSEFFAIKTGGEYFTVRDVTADADGKLWLASEKGVGVFDPKTKMFRLYQHDENNANSIGSNDIWRVYRDKQGRIWAAADQGGLNLYHHENDNFIAYKNIPGDNSSLSSDIVRIVYQDRTGDFWIGLYPEGVEYFDISTASVSTFTNNAEDESSLSHNSVLTLVEDERGNLWLGTDGGGLNYFDRASGQFAHFKHDPNDDTTIAANAVLDILIDSYNTLWMGHWGGGLSRMDLSTMEITRYPFSNPYENTPGMLNSKSVWNIYEDKNKDLWFATLDGGLNKYNREDNSFSHFLPSADKNSISINWVWIILEDSQNNFWVGTTNGLNLLDRERGTFKQYLHDPNDLNSISSPVIFDIFEDSKHRLWIGTDKGLNLFNSRKGTFEHITVKDGLYSDKIRSIVEDEFGKLWLGTAGGASTYDPENGIIKNYNRDAGHLVGGFNFDAAIYSSRKEVIFGGAKGLRIYKPDQLLGNDVPPQVALTKLKLFSEEVTVNSPGRILTRDINYTDEIVLGYDQSVLELEFASLNYRETGKNRYRYKLEGFDENWVNAGAQRRAKYTNLEPKKYIFKVQASNNDGVWNTEGKTIKIRKLSPPWSSWWAYSVYLFVAFLVVLGFIQSQRRKRVVVEHQNLLLEQKVSERTAELEQKNKEIHSMLSNMRQGLFSILGNGEIQRGYSRYLEKIYETDDIEGKHFCEVLFKNSNISEDKVANFSTVVDMVVGQAPSEFDSKYNFLVDEYEININGQKKYLHLEWYPIVDDGLVSKIMVTVRNVTQLKEMESQSQSKVRELELVSELLKLTNNEFIEFRRNSRQLLTKNKTIVEQLSNSSDAAYAELLENLHNIHEQSQQCGFALLSDIANGVEKYYQQLRDETASKLDKVKMFEDLVIIETVLDDYSNINSRLLGRDEKGAF